MTEPIDKDQLAPFPEELLDEAPDRCLFCNVRVDARVVGLCVHGTRNILYALCVDCWNSAEGAREDLQKKIRRIIGRLVA